METLDRRHNGVRTVGVPDTSGRIHKRVQVQATWPWWRVLAFVGGPILAIAVVLWAVNLFVVDSRVHGAIDEATNEPAGVIHIGMHKCVDEAIKEFEQTVDEDVKVLTDKIADNTEAIGRVEERQEATQEQLRDMQRELIEEIRRR